MEKEVKQVLIGLSKGFLELIEATQSIRRLDWDFLMMIIDREDSETLRKARTLVMKSKEHWCHRYQEIKKDIEEKLISLDLELKKP